MLRDGKPLIPVSTKLTSQRNRQSGKEKALFELPSGDKPALTGEIEMLMRYRHVFTIDTNSIKIGENLVSFASISITSFVPKLGAADTFYMVTESPGGYEFHGVADKQERVAWALLQASIVNSVSFDPTAKYLILTDHGKSEHSAINARKVGLIDEIMLADGLDLGFATSDSGKAVCQRLIRWCDRASGSFLRDVKSGKVEKSTFRPDNASRVSAFRIVANLAKRARQPEGLPAFQFNGDFEIFKGIL